MRVLRLPGVAIAGALSATCAIADVDGLWKTGAGESGGYLHVRFDACEERICGVVASAFAEDGVRDDAYEHLGKVMVRDMREEGENRWGGGRIWAPDTGRTYRSKMHLENDVLSVSGCVLGGLFCRSMDWHRVE